MARFIPVIYTTPDFFLVLEDTLVDIEHELNGKMITMRFDLSNSTPPILPFTYMSTIIAGDFKRAFVVDVFGGVWVQRKDGIMDIVQNDQFLLVLMQCESPHFNDVLKLLLKAEAEYGDETDETEEMVEESEEFNEFDAEELSS